MVQPKSLPCYSFSLATFTSPPEVSSHDEDEDEEVSRADCGTHDAPDPSQPAPSNTIPAMCITIALVCVSKLVVDVMADPNRNFLDCALFAVAVGRTVHLPSFQSTFNGICVLLPKTQSRIGLTHPFLLVIQ